jgi:hypothetical protein
VIRSLSRAAVASAVAAAIAIAVLLMPLSPTGLGPEPARAASPEMTPAGGGGDPRSVGEGPGLVGDPLFAVALVLAIGLLAAGLTALYVRASGGPRNPPPPGGPARPR